MINKLIMKRFLSLDNNKPLPYYIRLFMVFSPEIRDEINRFQNSMQLLYNSSPFRISSDISKNVMRTIKKEPIYIKQSVSNMNWITTGLVLLSSLVALSFSKYFQWLKGQFGSYVEISLYAVLGIAITVYASMFIASHLDLFKKHN